MRLSAASKMELAKSVEATTTALINMVLALIKRQDMLMYWPQDLSLERPM